MVQDRAAWMRRSMVMLTLGWLLSAGLAPGRILAGEAVQVVTIKTPDGGIQPQAVVAPDGTLHLLYFKGEPGAGDLYHVRRAPGAAEFSRPIRVNSQPGSAVATGTIRGGQIALGRDGRVHVAWNGATGASPPNPIKGAPMLHARSTKDGSGFEPQRNLMRKSFHLDGGGSIAADREGHVYVAWHGASLDGEPGEAGRRLWVAHSRDDGETFDAEKPALSQASGACACCGTKALADKDGVLYILYRIARGGVDRDMTLAVSADHGESFQATMLQPWPVTTCPMSSASLVETPRGVLAAWETQGQVAFCRVEPGALGPSPAVSPPGTGQRKHPVVASSPTGETLLAWTEGTGWKQGGALAWRLFGPDGRATSVSGRIENGVPVWGLPAAVFLRDQFIIFY